MWCGLLWVGGAAWAMTAAAAPPDRWISRGPGGGGAFFAPSINPYQPDEIWVGSDMSDLFRSDDFGRTWETVDFRILQGGNKSGRMEFTSDPKVRYALNDSIPMRTTDGGLSWTGVPRDIWSPWVDGLWADPTTTNRLLTASYTTLYLSTNSGASWRGVFTNNDQLIAGVFWEGPRMYVGTRAGVLVSTNGGLAFATPNAAGWGAGEAMISLAGAREGTTTRLFCVTWNSSEVYPGVQGSSYESYIKTYRLDGGAGTWTACTNGIGANQLFSLAMLPTNISVVYGAGSDGLGQPSVVKSVNGGSTWTQVLRCTANVNVSTGWSGDDSGPWNWKKWSYGECAMGFTVCASDPSRAVLTDFGFIHVTTNGGANWRPAYVWEGHENPAGTTTPKTNFYSGCGLEDTSCWWLEWWDSHTVFSGFTDVRGMWSTNAGRSWMSPMSLAYNSTYMAVRHPTNGALYGAMSSVHDLYAWDAYCRDDRLDGGSGAIMISTNRGASWSVMKNFGRPVVHLALDPKDPNRLYASMVHSVSGGIFRTTNLGAGVSAAWTRLTAPPRTHGHPYNVQVLNDGAIVATYSARLTNDFEPSSGVFISTNDGAGWLDRTDPGMRYYTKDLAVDPHDPSQNTWYAGVWGEWGASEGLGGLYRTTNRGLAWTRITTHLKAVGSCAVDPQYPDEMFVTTEDQGLWHTGNRSAAMPDFTAIAGYPFRFPSRVFFNPFDSNEIWVTSFGNGLRMGRRVDPAPRIAGASPETGFLVVEAAHGQRIVTGLSANLVGWRAIFTNWVFSESFQVPIESGISPAFYRAEIR